MSQGVPTFKDFPCDICGEVKDCVRVEYGSVVVKDFVRVDCGPVVRYVCRTCSGVISLLWGQVLRETAERFLSELTRE
jgi:hypothetical protein